MNDTSTLMRISMLRTCRLYDLLQATEVGYP